jgi:hypothetical protein
MRRLIVMILTLGLGSVAILIATKHPANDRQWTEEHARLPRISIDDSVAAIEEVRNFRWTDQAHFTPGYAAHRYRHDRLESVWLVLTPFSRSWRGPAHAFVTFGFSDSTYLAISIEARREQGEEYGIFRGLGRNYELIYLIGEEADLIGKRALGPFDVYLYPIAASPEKVRALFLDMLARARALGQRPEFYNTATNNCTSNLVRHVNQVSPGRVPAGITILLPGYADRVARDLGLIQADGSIDLVRTRFRINDRARAALDQGDFSHRIRQPTSR